MLVDDAISEQAYSSLIEMELFPVAVMGGATGNGSKGL